MPELPEVETIARGLAKRVTGDVIDSVWLGQKPEPLKSPANEIAVTLEHSRITAVRRIGKHIVFDLEPNGVADVGRAPSPAKSRATARTFSRFKVRTSRTQNPADEGVRRSTRTQELSDEGVRPTQTQNPADGGVRRSTTNTSQWIVHLGMTGRLQVCEPQAELLKHTHAVLKLASGRELRFVDPRRFGRLSVVQTGNFNAGGFEPLDVESTASLRYSMAARRR